MGNLKLEEFYVLYSFDWLLFTECQTWDDAFFFQKYSRFAAHKRVKRPAIQDHLIPISKTESFQSILYFQQMLIYIMFYTEAGNLVWVGENNLTPLLEME